MARVLIEIEVADGTPLPPGKKFLHRAVRLELGDAPPLVVNTQTATATFLSVPAGTYSVTIQDVADDNTPIGTAVVGDLLVGSSVPPVGGTYSASTGFSAQVLA